MSSNIVRLTLMNKNVPVIDFDYDTSLNVVLCIYHTYPLNEKYAPISIRDLKVGINKKDLMNWFKNRIIPETRDGIDKYLEKYNNDYNLFMSNLISKGHGFSLSDQYWFKVYDEEFTWEEGNYFLNDFDEITGRKIINKNIKSYNTPSSSTNGNLYKIWIIENGRRFLLKGSSFIKQEPYNEIIATKLYNRLLVDGEYIPYELYSEKDTGRIFSKCECFTNSNTELVPAWDIIKTQKQSNDENDYSFFLRCALSLGISNVKEYMNKLLTCDYILGNSDRHYNNFGAIRDVNTLEFYKMSPIFDNGNSLGIIRNDEYKLTTAPFYKDPKKQLGLVDDLVWFDETKLDGFVDEVYDILKLDTLLSEEYISKQISELSQRIEDVKDYKNFLNKKTSIN